MGNKKTPLKVSWSSIQTFLSCQRKYELGYVHDLSRPPSADHKLMMLGSAFHAGIEAAIRYVWSIRHSHDYEFHLANNLVPVAIAAVRDYVKVSTVQNKTIKNYTTGGSMLDVEYYQMVEEVAVQAVALIHYHLPLIGLGTAWLPTSFKDLVNNVPPGTYADEDAEPVIEYHFEYLVDDETRLTGYIDTVLWDAANGMYVLVDWKTRGNFPMDSLALIDGQLHLYAAVINAIAESAEPPITNVVMWQFRTKLPSPASISGTTYLPNTGAKSYDTTWEVWKATLPLGIDPARYEKIIRPKLKEDSEYQNAVFGVVTRLSDVMALDNVAVAAAAMRGALASGKPLPAIYSSNGCKFCDFAQLCTNVLRYGGDADQVIRENYIKRTEELPVEVVE